MMPSFRCIARRSSVVVAAAGVLAGCSGANTTTPGSFSNGFGTTSTQSAVTQSILTGSTARSAAGLDAGVPRPAGRAGSFLSPDAKSGKGLIYWGDYNNSTITIYKSKGTNPPQVGQITNGLSNPERLFVDGKGYVYATNIGSGSITAYAPGATMPSLTLTNGVDRPLGIFVDDEGTIYSTNAGNDTVTVYHHGKTSPSLTITLTVSPQNVAVDSAKNVYVAYVGGSGAGVIKFPKGSTKGTDLGLQIGAAGACDIAVDHAGNIVLVNNGQQSLAIFPAGKTQPSKTIAIGGTPFELSLNKAETTVYVSVEITGGFAVETFAYPNGTALHDKVTTNAGQWPLAVSPDYLQ